MKAGGNPEFKKSEQLRAEQIKKKAEEDKKQAEMRELFKPIAVQKVLLYNCLDIYLSESQHT